MKLPTAAAVALMSECRTKVLVLERNGLNSIPGGKGEFGETHEDTARREFLEETGLRLGKLVEISRFSSTKFDIVRYVAVEYSGVLVVDGPEGKASWRHVRLLGSKSRFPKADSELARLLSDGGWSK